MTDIYLVTGFLGAGKTTLMKNLLRVFKNSRNALIVNEFGQEGVDGAVLAREGMVLEEIVDGSIFCVCRSDKFIETILKTKELEIDCLLVESSGLADPFGMHEVMGIINKSAPGSFHYSGSVCLVDAKNFKRIYGLAPAAGQQVAGADLIFINKTDLAAPEDIRELQEIILSLNRHAPVIETSFGRIPDAEQIYSLQWHQPDRKGVLLKKTLGISKFTLQFGAVPAAQLAAWLKSWAGRTYRVKGFCEGYFLEAVRDEVSVSEFPDKREKNFLVVLAPADDSLKKEIADTWGAQFKIPLEINS